MKKILTIIAIVTFSICFGQNGIGVSSKVLSKSKDSTIVFKEEVKEDQFVYCEIDSIWKERRIIITTEVVSLFYPNTKKRIFIKFARIYTAENNNNIKIKTLSEESSDKYIDDILDSARLYVINDLRKLKP